MISPIYSKIEEGANYPGVKFYKVDVDEQEVSCALMSRDVRLLSRIGYCS